MLKGVKKAFGHSDEVDKYEIVKQLGEGGFGAVHQAHRKGQAEGTDVALKIMDLDAILKATGLSQSRLKRRMKNFRELMDPDSHHPNIYSVYSSYIDGGRIYVFLELCSGGDLFDRIVNHPDGHLTEEESRQTARALCGALAHLHARGFMHRDIKPENIFYPSRDSGYNDLLIGDFGCALDEVEPHQLFFDQAGSAGYEAPEMVLGQGYGCTIDEFSLGMTMYSCLTGRSPLISENRTALECEVVERPIPYPKACWAPISREAKAFVSRLLAKDPRQRMTAAEALEHPWLTQGIDLSYESESSEATSSADLHHGTSRMSRSDRTTLSSFISSKSATSKVPEGWRDCFRCDDILQGKIPMRQMTDIARLESASKVESSSEDEAGRLPNSCDVSGFA